MKFRSLFLAILWLIICSTIINAQSWDWVKSFTGPNSDDALCVKSDHNGNIYVGGRFKDTLFFTADDFLTAPTNYFDGFIAKFDSSGNFLWAHKFGGNHNDYTRAISIDDSGFVYLACYARSSNTVSFGSFSYTGTGNNKTFILKLDPLGNIVWGKLITAGISNAVPVSISVNAGIVAVTGSYAFLDMIIENDTLLHAGGDDIFMAVYESTTGNLLWTKALNSQFQDYARQVAVDDSANVYFSGIFNATLNLGGADTLYNPLGYEAFLCKHNVQGQYLWSKRFRGTGDHDVDGMTLNQNGNIYIAGFHGSGNQELNDTLYNTSSNNNFFLQKLNKNGESFWTKVFAGGNLGRISAIAADNNDNLYMSGYLGSTFTIGTFQVSGGSSNYRNFIAQISGSGDVIHAIDGGNRVNNNGINNLASTADGAYLVGYFGTVQGHICVFGSDTLISSGGSDGYLVKYKGTTAVSCNVIAQFTPSTNQTCQNDTIHFANESTNALQYEWFVNGMPEDTASNFSYLFSEPGTHEVRLIAVNNNCYDTIEALITIYEIENTPISVSICHGDTFLLGNQTYTTSGTYSQNFQTQHGCDSIVELELFIHHIDTTVENNQQVLTSSAFNVSYQWVDCNNAFAPITGENAQSFEATESGSYAVIITDSLCIDTSGCHNIVLVNISNNSDKTPEISFFPNPVSGTLYIQVQQEIDFTIINTLGTVVHSRTLNPGLSTLKLSHLAKGVYYLKFKSAKGSRLEKIIIN